MNPSLYSYLQPIFNKAGYKLYLVGGAVRDELLHKPSLDEDYVTDATPEQMKKILPNCDSSFAKYGVIRFYYQNKRYEITTFREETYLAARKPSSIRYVTSPRLDAKRRDFTMNALYKDNQQILDFYDGIKDIQNKVIRMIGDPQIRIKEDPLRILRALRFHLEFDFIIEPSFDKVIRENLNLLKRISYTQIKKEIQKMKEISISGFKKIVEEYSLDQFIAIHLNSSIIPMIDLHCDTITRVYAEHKSIVSNDLHVDLQKLTQANSKLQCFALFLNKKNGDLWEQYLRYYHFYQEILKEESYLLQPIYRYEDYGKIGERIGALLTIEEGGVLEGDLSRLDTLYNHGVRLITLTWNYKNEIGSPNIDLDKEIDLIHSNIEDGLTIFGKKVIHRMNELGMIIDVSHLSDKGFYDVLATSTKPIVASHSGCRAICNQNRNLTDEMIIALNKNHGVMGINYCPDFVGDNGSLSKLIEHFKHVKELGCINVLALGSDFDGIPTPLAFSSIQDVPLLIDALVENGFTKLEIEKIFYKNFLRLMKKVLH